MRRKTAPEWVVEDVLVPLLGQWAGFAEPSSSPCRSGLIGEINELARVVRTMAGNAQHDALPQLKNSRTELERAVKRYSAAVAFAEKRAKLYAANMKVKAYNAKHPNLRT